MNAEDEGAADLGRLYSQEDFWSAHPCGTVGSFAERAAFRYHREPWIKPLVKEVATRHCRVLEIGCGQGIDGIGICFHMPDGRYLGIDYSDESVRTAERMFGDATKTVALSIRPEFRVGNAVALDLPDNSFDSVYSIGVMHHTPSVQSCVDEAYRVLEPGGVAYLALYRKYSLKVSIAKALRAVQSGFDWVSGSDRSIYYNWFRRKGPSSSSGTMFLECFGVPFMEWYSRPELMKLFRRFEIISIDPVGPNFLYARSLSRDVNTWGYMWLIRARKPAATSSAAD